MDARALIALVSAFLSGAILIILGHAFGAPRERLDELWKLYRFELLLVGFILGPAYLGEIPFGIAIAVLALRAQYELQQAWGPGSVAETTFLALVTLSFLAVALWSDEIAVLRSMLIVVHALLVIDILRPPSADRMERMGKRLIVCLYPAVFLAFLVLLRRLPEGFLLIYLFFGVIEINDSFALVIGKLWGRRKLFPSLTPKKTYEGLFGGAFCAGGIGLIVGLTVTPFPASFVCGATSLALIATLVGDLVASKIKRNIGLKDFGHSFTLHGGLLDVYDSLIFAGPVFYWFAVHFRGAPL